ncbi:flagellin, partial [Betaproteobacteria bacterium LSUCC0115]|nr:flagellin [Burkholderiales bacterium LSUCC0115]
MASVINTNLASLYAQKNLSGAQNALSTSVERLSSGLRINRAKDDAAGLGISEKIKSQVTALNQGIRNANDAISMVQTAEGSLSEVSTILQRMKELSVQARNESLSTVQRSYISDELVALKNEINSIAERTTFNDLSLLKNALRTDVVSSTAANKLQNGATVLDDISVSGVSLKNANAGTYSFTTGTVEDITGQLSRASSKYFGTVGAD